MRRISPYRRRLMFTERGLARLRLRAYRVFGETLAASRQLGMDRPEATLIDKAFSARATDRLKQAVAIASRQYLEHPCALSNGPRIMHELGLPQADTISLMGVGHRSQGPQAGGPSVLSRWLDPLGIRNSQF